VVAGTIGLEDRVRWADLVISGEGAFDATSRDGKVVGHVLELARTAGVPAVVLAGRVDDGGKVDGEMGRVEVRSMTDEVGREAAMADPRGSLISVAASTAESFGATR
jgi:glycerate kinase